LALGAGAYLAFTLAAFPAGTALRWWAPPGIAFQGVEGTLWSGGAASGSAAGFTAQDLRWRVRPWSLLLGRVSASVEARFPDGFVSTDVVATPSRVRLTALRGGTSLPSLVEMLPALLPVRGIRGQASVAFDSIEIENGWPVSAVGELKLGGLEAAPFIPNGTGDLLALGDYTVTFTPASEGELAARFVDNGGPLEVSGSVKLDAGLNYTLDALIEARPGAPETLVQGLEYMTAEPDAEGRRRLTLTGSL
jgi:general secretion pathway protein N